MVVVVADDVARYDYLMDHVLGFMNHTGLTMVETDGPYPGYQCTSTNHSYHEGADDSVYSQLKLQSLMYRILREREVYINQPDNYFYQGGSKTGAMCGDISVNLISMAFTKRYGESIDNTVEENSSIFSLI